MSDSLEQLLDSLKRQGGTHHSSGQFMVDLQKAREKLRQFQLSEPCFYLLKLVQALIRAGAEAIDIRLDRLAVDVTSSLPEESPFLQAPKVVSALSCADGESPALRHLSVALNAAWAMNPEKIVWAGWSAGQGYGLEITPDDLALVELARCPEWATGRRQRWVRFAMRRPSTLTNLARNLASEHEQVLSRCSYSAVPIYLNEDRLQGSWPRPRPHRWHRGLTPSFYLGQRFELDSESSLALASPEIGHLTPEDGAYYQCHSVSGTADTQFPTFCTQLTGPRQPLGMPLTCHQAMAVSLALEGPAQLQFVIDGVTMDPIQLDLGVPGLICLAEAGGLRTDLSEFAIIRDEAFDRRLEALRVSAQSLRDAITANIYRLPCHFHENSDDGRQLLSCVGCLFGGPLLGLLVAGLTSAAGNLSDRAKVARFGQLRRKVEERLR
ncbi:MAG: hypothetical protein KC910_21615 [Candidatus Eremiobacteraeota bacterium]|nr:hypothetical protein [Candidatus Eremiobacteraeota bacterium]